VDDGSLDFGIEEDKSGGLEPSFDVDESSLADDGGLDFSVDSGSDDSGLEDFGEMADGLDTSVAEDTAVATAENEDSQQWDETATKLDLAKAYIDMGDADGARSILDEVMSEGNTSQKQQAEDLMAQIA
jgi:pilus assembly protein FimV